MKNEYFTKEQNIQADLIEIKRVFNVKSIKTEKFHTSSIQKYYNSSSKAFELFHSKDGAVHMAINYDHVYNEIGYRTQATEISKQVLPNQSILEIGCGKGYNISILAEKHKKSFFTGIDISKKHLEFAKKKNMQKT